MTDTSFTESDHPRETTGEFTLKPQSAPEIAALSKTDVDATLSGIDARIRALHQAENSISLELAKLNGKALAVAILAECPHAKTLTLTESDQSENWWAGEILGETGAVIADDTEDYDVDNIPMSSPIATTLVDGQYTFDTAAGFEWLTFEAPHFRGGSATGKIDLVKAAAIEV